MVLFSLSSLLKNVPFVHGGSSDIRSSCELAALWVKVNKGEACRLQTPQNTLLPERAGKSHWQMCFGVSQTQNDMQHFAELKRWPADCVPHEESL